MEERVTEDKQAAQEALMEVQRQAAQELAELQNQVCKNAR